MIVSLSLQSPGCNKICDVIARATETNPPQLPVASAARERPLADDESPAAAVAARLTGSWASVRCETRSYGVFLTRHFEFSTTTSGSAIFDSAATEAATAVDWKRKFNWSARHGYYGDVLCRRAMYAVETSGSYRIEDREDAGGTGTDFEGSSTSAERNIMVDSFFIEFNVLKYLLFINFIQY